MLCLQTLSDLLGGTPNPKIALYSLRTLQHLSYSQPGEPILDGCRVLVPLHNPDAQFRLFLDADPKLMQRLLSFVILNAAGVPSTDLEMVGWEARTVFLRSLEAVSGPAWRYIVKRSASPG